jgi:hypothetical protein
MTPAEASRGFGASPGVLPAARRRPAIRLHESLKAIRRELLVGGLKQLRRVATRHEMTVESYPAMLTLAPIPLLRL